MESDQEAIGREHPPTNEEAEASDSHPMDVLLEEGAYALETPRRGEIRIGTVARVTENDVLVDIGAKSEGVIPASELQQLTEEQRARLQVGEEVTVYVVRAGGRDGTIELSLLRAEEEKDWDRAEELLQSQENFEGVINGYNKGGLIVRLGRLRGFIPASQVSLSRRRRAQGSTPEQRWGKMVGEPIVAKVIEVDRRRNRLILSERAASREAREVLKEKLIEELQPGEVRTGHVISLTDYGAFVDIGGADGLVHTSEISWKRINHPSEVLKVGQKVKVKVLDLDRERKRISLSLRELEDDPWDEIVGKFREGQLVEGTITKLTKFGAFARLAGTEDYDIEGLIHISELSDQRINHPREVVQEGETLTLRLIRIDSERRRIGLSLRKVNDPSYAELDWQVAMEEAQAAEAEPPASEPEVGETPLEGEAAVTAEGAAGAEPPATGLEVGPEIPGPEASSEAVAEAGTSEAEAADEGDGRPMTAAAAGVRAETAAPEAPAEAAAEGAEPAAGETAESEAEAVAPEAPTEAVSEAAEGEDEGGGDEQRQA